MDQSSTYRILSVIAQMGLQGGDRIPFYLVGGPGIGKSDIQQQIADQISQHLGRPFPLELRSGPSMQPEDVSGLPVPNLEAKEVDMYPWRIGKQVLENQAGMVVIDEFGSVDEQTESALLNFFQGGKLGEHTLPHTVALGAIGNPAEIASNGRNLSAPAANRFCWLQGGYDNNAYVDFLSGGKGLATKVDILPENWEKNYLPTAKLIAASYLRRNPHAGYHLPEAHKAGCAWPSPRSWLNGLRLMAAFESLGFKYTSDISHLALSGCIGDDAAATFVTWFLDIKLPDPEEILANPSKLEKLMPERNDHREVALDALASAAVKDHPDQTKRYDLAMDIIANFFKKEQDVALRAFFFLCSHIHKVKDAANTQTLKECVKELEKLGYKPRIA